MTKITVASQSEWLEQRLELLQKEKELTRMRDAVSAQRRSLPWVKVDKAYSFTEAGKTLSLAKLFGDKSQLIIYHFMYGPEWEQGCASCSFWADNFDGIACHLAARDITFMAISSAPFDQLAAYKRRMGWYFRWVSSYGTEFNQDFGVGFSEEQKSAGLVNYNYKEQPWFIDELVGASVFVRDDTGIIYHTYSTYSRGMDILNGAYHYIDLVPKGRDEEKGKTMAWLRRHDEYQADEA